MIDKIHADAEGRLRLKASATERLPQACLSISRKSFSEIVKLRRELHQCPELAFDEFNTGKIIARELNKLNIPTKSGVGKTGLVGIINGERERENGKRSMTDSSRKHR